MSMSAMAAETFPFEGAVELWDGEEVVKGQPTPSHEAIRAQVIVQLSAQCPPGLSIRVSSAVGDDRNCAQSDGSVVDVTSQPRCTPVWVEVLSTSDLRGDARLTAQRRRRFLFDNGVAGLWVFLYHYGTITLTVHHADGTVEAFASPGEVTLPVRHSGGERNVTIDLGAIEAAAQQAGEE